MSSSNTHYVTCKCGNLVTVKDKHDFSVLPCPECRKKENTDWKTGVNLEDDRKALILGIVLFLILVGLFLCGIGVWRLWG